LRLRELADTVTLTRYTRQRYIASFISESMRSDRDNFPSAIEACFLVFLLLLLEYFIIAVVREIDGFTRLGLTDVWDSSPLLAMAC
jgi:hypothetical protein